MAVEGYVMGVGKVTHGGRSGLTVTRTEWPDGIEAQQTSMLPLKCHGSPIVFLRCVGLCSRCSTVCECHGIREDEAFVCFVFVWTFFNHAWLLDDCSDGVPWRYSCFKEQAVWKDCLVMLYSVFNTLTLLTISPVFYVCQFDRMWFR